MQLKLPSPEQIYDLSTDQLSKLKSDLSFNISKKQTNISTTNNKSTNDEIQSLKQLLENIQLQIQQRKTIEFFTQLCINDGTANKYVKEITDFNNQFTKLANEMLNNNKSNGEGSLQEQEKFFYQKKKKNLSELNQDEHSQHSFQSKLQKKQLERRPSQTTINSQDTDTDHHSHTTTQTTTHFSKSTTTDPAFKTVSKQMGLGHHPNMKKNKKSMQDFIKATLAKSKAVDYVSTKGGMIKSTPDKVEKNGSHLTSNHNNDANRTPLSTSKSIKAPGQGSQLASHRSETKRPAQSSTKNVPVQSTKSISEKNDRNSLMKKRDEVIEKVRNMKKPQANNLATQSHPPQPPKKKTMTKGLDAKSLVQMVKQQQDAKKKRQQQQTTADYKPKQEKEKPKQKVDQQKNQVIKSSSMTSILGQQSQQQQKSKKSNQNRIEETTNSLTNNNNTTKLQSQFPIKEQINPILSQSDSESDPDSGKLISNQKYPKGNKKNISKEQVKKDSKYFPIQQEQIEESIAAFKQFKIEEQMKCKESQKIKGKENQTIKGKQNKNNQQINTIINNQQKNNQANDHAQNQKNILTTEKSKQTISVSNNQIFGKITQQQYNPYGYEDNQKEQKEKQHQIRQQQQKDGQVSENDQKNDQRVKQSTENLLSSKKSQQQKINKDKPFKKGSKKSIQHIQKKPSQELNPKQYSVNPSLQQIQSTKMYNEQYWLHIKEQAESKIQRFKQQKQLQRKERQHKAKLIQEESKRIKMQLQNKKSGKQKKLQNLQNMSEEVENNKEGQNNQQIGAQQDENDKFIKQQKDNLKKIYAQNNMNDGSSKKSTKKPSITAIIKQPKPSFPKPQFNYLEVYPTFNHIFNVFYTKPQNQAVQDIPSIMKEMIQMFQTHIDFQKNRKNNFRPAIFLPFDSRNSKINQFTDARSLLQHAQTTYVNLKTLIERVEIFNSNIQGQFQNCTDEQRSKTQFYRVVKTREEVYDIISTSFLRRKGWKELPHGQNLKANWNLFWSWAKPQIDMNKLLIFQRINHYPFNKNLSRKDLLYKNIDSFRKTHKVPFPYLPITYNLPKQFTQFSKRFHEQQMVNRDKNYWIMKPIGKSRGRGIKLINSLGDLNYLDNIVVQKYISNPLLIDGYKFDMRIYVLVTSFHPLEAFVYRQGFARFSTQKYSLQPMDMKNNFVHLTNFAINKDNRQADDQFAEGSKISLKSLKQRVTKMGYSFASVWSQVHEIIIKSLLACSVSVPPFPAAFELFGYDVMLDDKGQCYLIEINSSPSLQRSYMIDEVIKQSLIDDIIQIINAPNFSKQQAINVMNERLSPDFRNNKKSNQKNTNFQEQDLIHMARILKYQKLRKYGQMPEKIGLFEMVAPSPMSKQLQKLIKSKSGINAPHNID